MLVAEALIEAGVLVGLPRPVAAQLVAQTLLGSATLLAQSDDGPEALRAAVTSPGGTTAAGLRALEDARGAGRVRRRGGGRDGTVTRARSGGLVTGRRAWRRPQGPQSVAAARLVGVLEAGFSSRSAPIDRAM